MSRKIPKYFINELLYKTNIVELINSRITLRKKGKNYQTNCPFHHDKTPSFTVNYEKQFYYCFGCSAHGNVIDFLINYERLNFIESIEELSIIHGVNIPFKNTVQHQNNDYFKRQKLYFLMSQLSQLYQKNVTFSHSSMNYLLKRGIKKKIINLFSIGYASNNWSVFCKNLNIDKKFESELKKFNILSVNNRQNKYDRFQGRIIFPIQDKYGRIVGFGGRTIYNNKLPKYINSPETDIFHKKKQIYGLYQALQTSSKPKYLLVVEGYIDVITLTQYNINYVVSSLGTSTTKEHIQLLFRETNVIIYCYDGDQAGKNASWKALNTALPYISDKKTLKFILLPHNEDPDTIIKKEGKEKFQDRIDNAIPFSKFFFNNILKNINLSSSEDKFYLSEIALPLINQISSITIKIYLHQILVRKIGILDDDHFIKFLYAKKNKKNNNKKFTIKRTLMRTLIGLLIQNPHLATVVPSIEKIKTFKLKGIPIFIKILKTCIDYPNLNTGQLLELYRNSKIINILRILARWDHMIIKKETKNMFLDLLKKINEKNLEKRQEYLISQERIKGLTINEKKEIWFINKELSKKKI